MKIPYQQLSPEAVQGLLEEFVTREGTDYGDFEVPLSAKVAQLMQQLKRGDLVIVFNPQFESCTLITKIDFERAADAI